jgi:8-oxo-dGTP pyrophosphatase MutT (NUDIX family)
MRIEALLQTSPGEYVCEKLADPRYPQNIGKIRCPGGRQEHGESPSQTLIRELHEEYGLVISQSQIGPEVCLDALPRCDAVKRFIVFVDSDIVGKRSVEGGGEQLVRVYHYSPAPWSY